MNIYDDMLRLRHNDDWNRSIPYLKISVQQYMNEDKHDHFIKVKQEKSMKEINEEVLKRMKEKNISPLPRKKNERHTTMSSIHRVGQRSSQLTGDILLIMTWTLLLLSN